MDLAPRAASRLTQPRWCRSLMLLNAAAIDSDSLVCLVPLLGHMSVEEFNIAFATVLKARHSHTGPVSSTHVLVFKLFYAWQSLV